MRQPLHFHRIKKQQQRDIQKWCKLSFSKQRFSPPTQTHPLRSRLQLEQKTSTSWAEGCVRCLCIRRRGTVFLEVSCFPVMSCPWDLLYILFPLASCPSSLITVLSQIGSIPFFVFSLLSCASFSLCAYRLSFLSPSPLSNRVFCFF